MLTYEEFKEEMVRSILDYLPEEYAACHVSIERVIKNNDSVNDGLLIRREDTGISPNIYLEHFYEEYECGRSFEKICRQIADIRVESDCRNELDVSMLMDFSVVRDHIYVSLINTARNKALLNTRPSRSFFDLSLIFYIDLTELPIGFSRPGLLSIPLTYDLINKYKVTEDEIYDIAMKNLFKVKPVCNYMHEYLVDLLVEKLKENQLSGEEFGRLIRDIENDKCPDFMYLTNETRIRGSAMMLNPDNLLKASEKMGGDFYILPSSVHELILISVSSKMCVTDMLRMVEDVNRNTVTKEDFLSNNVYYYSCSTGVVSLVKADSDPAYYEDCQM